MNALLKRPWLWPLLALALAGGWVGRGYLEWHRLLARENALVEEIGRLKAALATPSEKAKPLPPERLPELYKVLLRLAEKSGAELRSLAPGAGTVDLALRGPFEKLYAFLVRLPDLPYPIWVEQYQLTPETPKATRLDLDLTLGIRLKTEENPTNP